MGAMLADSAGLVDDPSVEPALVDVPELHRIGDAVMAGGDLAERRSVAGDEIVQRIRPGPHARAVDRLVQPQVPRKHSR